MPVDINRLTEGWLELESDPGLFTLLLEDFGVKGVQVEEIYDLQKSLEGPVYGFIFLFRWIEERRSRRKIVDQTESFVKDEEVVNSIFFAQQMVPNSCATHALISILLNCPNIHLGGTLSRLKTHTMGMCPENKGWAIGNTPELASAHNSHAMPQAKRRRDKTIGVSTGRSTGDAFHFVSYVPINGKLFELDGLKPYPMDHGPWGENEDWTEKFRKVITDRLGMTSGEQYHDIRFNLMAVVPDRRLALSHKLKMLNTNRQIVSEALLQIMKLNKKANKDRTWPKEKTGKIKDENNTDGNTSEEAGTENAGQPEVNGKPVGNGDSGESNANTSSLETRENRIRLGGKAASDYITPLTIQTSPSPSTASTDTSSEIGSAFNSPTQGWSWGSGQNSPNTGSVSPSGRSQGSATGTRRFLVEPPLKKVCLDLENSKLHQESSAAVQSAQHGQESSQQLETQSQEQSLNSPEKRQPPTLCCTTTRYTPEQFESPHAFAPQDLRALLKNLEAEITICQTNLRDENEKRKKYMVDDCRRTHNYDEFICTFLSMLAEQGKLADLVQQHQLGTSKKVPPNRLPADALCSHAQKVKKRLIKKPEPKSSSSPVSKKKRGRSKRRK